MNAGTRRSVLVAAIVGGAGLIGLTVGLLLPRAPKALPSLPPLSSSVTVLRPTPDVVTAVRALSRLESTAFHMERVIDLKDRQSRLFGLVSGEDAILLVAVADVTAGVDLAALGPADVEVSPDRTRVRIKLPRATVFSTVLDSEHTYVHTRRTDLLAKRNETLETSARKEAEHSLTQAALSAGILDKADAQARRVIRELVTALGFSEVEVVTRQPAEGRE
ncbi:MAG: DUF4230 domain-containing protein [Myxococcota bacterium]|jgi:Protein of unknown function (DUF4230)|nr:DUF4230 domain-containing protein [Myxococcota bacterium]